MAKERENMNNTSDMPMIKMFIQNGKCYCYDTCTNHLLCVNKEHYREIRELKEVGITKYRELGKLMESYQDVIALLDKGLFSPSLIDEIEHRDTKYLQALTNRCINQLVLCVVNTCNFKCRYCHQAEGKTLSSASVMSGDIARQSVDYLHEHSKDAFEVAITFYGGEPLLNFSLVRATVEYANSKFVTKKIVYNMTTNASLLSDEALDFMEKNDFLLLISLDGNAEIQNQHRKYLNNGGDTFDAVWKNVLHIREKYPSYFDSNVRFNAVILQDENPEEIVCFYAKNNIPEEKVNIQRADLNGIDYSASPLLLAAYSKDNRLVDAMYKGTLEKFADKSVIPRKWHHSGPCIPAARRLFVNADGKLYPCEKIDSDSSCLIGSLDQGIDIDKVEKMLNIGKISEHECKSCWAIRFCTMCVLNCIDDGKWSRSRKLANCKFQKREVLSFFEKYINNKENEMGEL